MKLSLEDIRKITCGAVNVKYENGEYHFYRFNEDEMAHYAKTRHKDKSYATSGISMNFETDARELSIFGSISSASSRAYYSFDIFKNGEILGHIKNFEESEMIPNYVSCSFEVGSFSGKFSLGEGKKSIRIVFPWSVAASVAEIELRGATFAEPIKKNKKMLMYGDSITQGYDAEFPSRAYAVALAEALGAEGFNKAIGGERFVPLLSAIKNDFSPDYISVAYGTNDWSNDEKEVFVKNSRAFYENLSKNYPKSKIFAISPIWRADNSAEKPLGKFYEVEEQIKSIADSLPNVTFISGIDLVPHDESYYADLRLHHS